MYHSRHMQIAELIVFLLSFFLCGITFYKVILYTRRHPNPLSKTIISALFFLCVGIILELVTGFTIYIRQVNPYYSDNFYFIVFMKKVYVFIAAAYHYSIIATFFIAAAGDFPKKIRFPLLFSFATLVIADILFRRQIISNYGITFGSNLVIRLVFYCITGIILIKALRGIHPKPILYIAAIFFSFDTISLLFLDILKILPLYHSLEYLLFFPIVFFYTIPFLQKLYPEVSKVMHDLDSLKLKYNLSDRETIIIQLVCDGKLNKEIADTLNLAENTIKSHIFNIYKKLNVKNRVELVKHITTPTKMQV